VWRLFFLWTGQEIAPASCISASLLKNGAHARVRAVPPGERPGSLDFSAITLAAPLVLPSSLLSQLPESRLLLFSTASAHSRAGSDVASQTSRCSSMAANSVTPLHSRPGRQLLRRYPVEVLGCSTRPCSMLNQVPTLRLKPSAAEVRWGSSIGENCPFGPKIIESHKPTTLHAILPDKPSGFLLMNPKRIPSSLKADDFDGERSRRPFREFSEESTLRQ